jgi:hypothetical protein
MLRQHAPLLLFSRQNNAAALIIVELLAIIRPLSFPAAAHDCGTRSQIFLHPFTSLRSAEAKTYVGNNISSRRDCFDLTSPFDEK